MFMNKVLKKPSKTLAFVFIAAAALVLLSGVYSSAFAAPAGVGPRPNNYDDPPNGIYVSPDGNDVGATGSIDRPYKSINTALSNANPGDTIILRSGIYREMQNVRINVPNITIKSRKGEWGIIDLTVYNPGNDQHSGVYYRPDASGCKLQSVEVRGGFYAVCMETTWEWGIQWYPTRYGASDIIIEDCILRDSRNDTVKVKPNCNNITIRYNEIFDSGREHLGSPSFVWGECNAEGIDNVNGHNMVVQNNYIHDICSTAIYAKGGAMDALIENNLIERAYAAGVMVGFDTSPQYFNTDTNPLYYENFRGIVRNNLIIDMGWEGIGLYAAKDAQVYNNTIVNACTYGVSKYHSPIYFGIATQDWSNPTGCPPSINPHIHHNIVSQPSTYNNRMIDIRYSTEVYRDPDVPLAGLSGMPTMHDNCYYVPGRSATFTDNRPGSFLQSASLAAWKAHTNSDNGSFEANPALNANYLPTNPLCTGMGFLGFSTTLVDDVFDVKGSVLSYNPQNRTLVQLMQGNVEKKRTEIPGAPGPIQLKQDFTIKGVEPGTYTLVVSKDLHVSFTINNLEVGDKDLDLTEHVNAAVRCITLPYGDLNGDGEINQADLNILWQPANYNKGPIVIDN